ncbi:hypothetical protein ACNKHM_25135 [Shigella sonnei]
MSNLWRGGIAFHIRCFRPVSDRFFNCCQNTVMRLLETLIAIAEKMKASLPPAQIVAMG